MTLRIATPPDQVRAKDASRKVAAKPDGSEQKPLRDVVAGALARAGSQATIHPIDTMKVRMQAGDMQNAGGYTCLLSSVPHRAYGVTGDSGTEPGSCMTWEKDVCTVHLNPNRP